MATGSALDCSATTRTSGTGSARPFDRDGAHRFVPRHGVEEAQHHLGEDDLALPRLTAEPAGEVHRVADDVVLAPTPTADVCGHDVTAVHADPELHGRYLHVGELRRQLRSTRLDLHRAVERDLGMLRDRQRCAEHGEDLVPDELQNGAALAEDDVRGQLVELVQHGTDLRRLERRRQRREPAHVAEEQAHVEPLTLDRGLDPPGLLELARHRLRHVLGEEGRHPTAVPRLRHVADPNATTNATTSAASG